MKRIIEVASQMLAAYSHVRMGVRHRELTEDGT